MMHDYRRELIAQKCKSPIEAMLLIALVESWDVGKEIGYCFRTDISDGDLPDRRPYDFLSYYQFNIIVPQAKVDQYTADFMLTRYAFWDNFSGEWAPQLRRLPWIALECDGHDFHERTKEQAAHDRSRDRYFAAKGYQTLRFTGSEIHRNVQKCIDDIDAVFDSIVEKWRDE